MFQCYLASIFCPRRGFLIGFDIIQVCLVPSAIFMKRVVFPYAKVGIFVRPKCLLFMIYVTANWPLRGNESS